FIGQHVVRELLRRGHEARSLDSLRADVHATASWTPPPRVETHVGDVRDSTAVDRALAGIDAEIHLAPNQGLGVDGGDMPDYVWSNDAGTADLLAGMARASVTRLTLASSMVVYGEGLARCAEHGLVVPAPRRESDLAAGRFEAPCPLCGQPLETGLI